MMLGNNKCTSQYERGSLRHKHKLPFHLCRILGKAKVLKPCWCDGKREASKPDFASFLKQTQPSRSALWVSVKENSNCMCKVPKVLDLRFDFWCMSKHQRCGSLCCKTMSQNTCRRLFEKCCSIWWIFEGWMVSDFSYIAGQSSKRRKDKWQKLSTTELGFPLMAMSQPRLLKLFLTISKIINHLFKLSAYIFLWRRRSYFTDKQHFKHFLDQQHQHEWHGNVNSLFLYTECRQGQSKKFQFRMSWHSGKMFHFSCISQWRRVKEGF